MTGRISKTVRLGLLGAGARNRGMVRRLLKQEGSEHIRVVSAYDPDPASRKAMIEALGYECRFTSSEGEVINDPDVDWIFVGSWNSQHARQAILALDAGKDIFCEKPLATTLEDCLAIREAVARSGRHFVFGLVLRYSPHYQRIIELVRSGKIGRIVSFEFNETLGFSHGGLIFRNWRRERKNAGTHLLEKCCHDLDLANWIVNSLPVRVASFGGRDFFTPEHAGQVARIGPNERGEAAYGSTPDRHPFDGKGDIVDNQVVILQYANGVRGTFHTNCNTAIPERRFYLCGTEGTLRADLRAGLLEVQRIEWNSEAEKINTVNEKFHGGGDDVMAAALVNTLLHGEAPLASIEEAIQSAVAAFGIDQALDESRIVDLAPLWNRAEIDPFRPLIELA